MIKLKLKLEVLKNSKSNLGKSLENDINLTNNYYLNNGIAVIYKKPTPVQVVRVNYPSRARCQITEAYYKTPSTTDYNGVFNGYYIDFDVKETHSKTAFPLSNIKPHQIAHLERVFHSGGVAFLIINFCQHSEYFILSYRSYLKFLSEFTTRKSIPRSFFKENCFLINYGYHPRLDYLQVIKNNLSCFIKNE